MRTPISAYDCQGFPQPQRADAVYRSVTIVAMLLLLATLWVF